MNSAEGGITEVKRLVGRWQVARQNPKVLWDYCVELALKVWSAMPNSVHKLDDESPETVIFGETADISHIYEHEWYDWILFNEPTHPFPEFKTVLLGRYIGRMNPGVGSVMSDKVLKSNGEIEHRNSIRHRPMRV
jgi:hypothetical protein